MREVWCNDAIGATGDKKVFVQRLALYFVSEVQINHLLLNFRQKCKMSQCIERDTNVLMLHLNNILLLTTTSWTIHLSLWSCHKVPIVQLFPCSLHRSHKVLLSWIAFYCFDWEAATDFGHFYSCRAISGKKRTRRHIYDAFPRCREAKIQVLSHFPEAGVWTLPEEGQGLLWDVLLTFPVQHVAQLLWLKNVVSHTPQHDCHSVEHFCDVVLSHTIYCQFFFFIVFKLKRSKSARNSVI